MSSSHNFETVSQFLYENSNMLPLFGERMNLVSAGIMSNSHNISIVRQLVYFLNENSSMLFVFGKE